jgi:monoamine oxidase
VPTLFTALQSHLRRPPAPWVPRTFQEAARARPTKPKRPRTPRRRLSLRNRFKVRPLKKPLRIAVVGGGFAGLAAAYELKSVGYRVTVFEARDEVGGRVLSERDVVPGFVVEHGAELIGLNHLAWWSYARKFKLKLDKLGEPDSPSPVVLEGKLLSPGEAEQLGTNMLRFERLINDEARPVNAYKPWLTPGADDLDDMSLATGIELIMSRAKKLRGKARIEMLDLCRLMFLKQLESDNGVKAEKQSWLGNLAMIKGGGLARYWRDSETHHCRGGNQRLARKLKAAVGTVRRNKEVRRIEIDAAAERRGVTLRFAGGKREEFDDVVLATPPTMWRERMHISPRLPKAYKVQFGKNVKYILNVENGCWDPESPELTSDGAVNITWLGTRTTKEDPRAGWVAFSGADAANTLRRWGKKRRREILKRLSLIYPRAGYEAGKGEFMDWLGDKWTRGSYSFPEPNEVMRVGRLMHESYEGHLHFAGEHTCYAFTGYMEGALRSGLRVAEQIARRDGVILPR